MALQPLDPSVIEQNQTELRDRLSSGSDVPQVNVEIVRALMNVGKFEFPAGSGNCFTVPRVPYADGIKLRDLWSRITLAQKDINNGIGHEIYEHQIREMLDIAWHLCVPEKRIMRIMRKLLPWANPFHRLAGEGDVAELLSFFMVLRMKSNVRFH